MISADDVRNAQFTPTKFRDGYDQMQVDNLLDRVVETLGQLEAGSTVGVGGRPLITPKELLSAKILRTKFREGYEADEVDQLLDKVVETLNGFIARAQRGDLDDRSAPEQRAGDVEQPEDVAAAAQELKEQERELFSLQRQRDDVVSRTSTNPGTSARPGVDTDGGSAAGAEPVALPEGAMRLGDVLREVQYSRATLIGGAREVVVVRGPDGRTRGIGRVEKTADGIVLHID